MPLWAWRHIWAPNEEEILNWVNDKANDFSFFIWDNRNLNNFCGVIVLYLCSINFCLQNFIFVLTRIFCQISCIVRFNAHLHWEMCFVFDLWLLHADYYFMTISGLVCIVWITQAFTCLRQIWITAWLFFGTMGSKWSHLSRGTACLLLPSPTFIFHIPFFPKA